MSRGLELRGVSKRYGGVQALIDVSLTFSAGEVHAVLGENGAGKSTLVNIVAGLTSPDSGQLRIDGTDMPVGNAIASRRAGIGVVHQHFTLVPSFTVAENIALFRVRSGGGRFNVDALAAPAIEKARQLGWSVNPSARVGGLPVGAQQRVEILKSLCDDEPILLFDEPTAPLGKDEVDDLLGILRQLAVEGRVVVLVAHKLKEVLAVADRVSVLRRGVVQAASLVAGEVTPGSLAELMVGELPAGGVAQQHATSESVLTVSNLEAKTDSGAPAVRGASFIAKGGEIFGIGGIDGNGQDELAEALAGIRPFKGSILLDGKPTERVAYIPADRQSDGLALGMSVSDNLLLGRLGSWPRRREVKQWANQLMKRFDVRVSGPDQMVSELSGGNQQKLVVARTLDLDPPVVVAVNPARGLDLKATEFVHERLRQARDAGSVVILISADLDELYAVADRVTFMSAGVLTVARSASEFVGGTP